MYSKAVEFGCPESVCMQMPFLFTIDPLHSERELYMWCLWVWRKLRWTTMPALPYTWGECFGGWMQCTQMWPLLCMELDTWICLIYRFAWFLSLLSLATFCLHLLFFLSCQLSHCRISSELHDYRLSDILQMYWLPVQHHSWQLTDLKGMCCSFLVCMSIVFECSLFSSECL